MLQQNGPTGQKEPEVIDITPSDQCLYCGCQTRQDRCPECRALLVPRVVCRKVAFIPSPLKLYAVDKRIGGDFQPAGHLTATSEMAGDAGPINFKEAIEMVKAIGRTREDLIAFFKSKGRLSYNHSRDSGLVREFIAANKSEQVREEDVPF